MNKLLKKTLATLSCTVLIGQVMLTSIAGATEELLTKDLDLDVTKDLTSPVLNLELNKNKTENTTTKSIDLVI